MTGAERLRAAFEARTARGERALVPYFTAGDPDLDTTRALLRAAVDASVDVIELGVPYSDPSADGPVLQAAAERALLGHVGLGDVIAAASTVAREVPVILFGYLNPFFQYGYDRLTRDAAAAGIAGVLVVDLPPEEAGPLLGALRAEGLALVPLVTPVTPDERLDLVAPLADGFVYYVSVTGVTGSSLGTAGPSADRLRAVRARLGRPIAVGFGVRTPEDARNVSEGADGVVVGSALVDLAFRTPAPERAAAVRAFLTELRDGLTGIG